MWRAYRVRRRLSACRPEEHRRRAAVTLQRWWRHCLICLRAEACWAESPLQMTLEEVEKYQRQIDRWEGETLGVGRVGSGVAADCRLFLVLVVRFVFGRFVFRRKLASNLPYHTYWPS